MSDSKHLVGRGHVEVRSGSGQSRSVEIVVGYMCGMMTSKSLTDQ